MRKKMDLKSFDVYQYLKEQHSQNYDAPYFLANQDTYKNASIRFPIRTFTYGIGITYAGKGGIFKIGSAEHQMQAGSLITIGPGIVSQWLGEYSDTHDTIYFTEELFKEVLKSSFLKSLTFFSPGGNHVITLSDEDTQKMKSLFKILKQFKNESDIITGIVFSLLMLVIKCHKMELKSKQRSFSIKEKIAGEFKSLLSKNFLEKKDVAFYANKLNITSKYLSETLLAETGSSAKAIIDEHIFLEAKSLLRQTSMTVQEICNWLGYADTSYFTKAFKKKEGIAPLQYRKL
jgi:AraC family transcriptional regulator, transcriptional activator of pobA